MSIALIDNLPRNKGMSTSGEKLKILRRQRRMSQEALGRKANVAAKTIYAWEQLKDYHERILDNNFRSLADALGMTEDELAQQLAPDDPPLEDRNVDPFSEVEVPEIPLFDLPIAAGVMTPLPPVEEYDEGQALAMKLKRYRVRIRGRSMEKEYADGSIVEFVCLEWRQGRTELESGKDYYVQTAEAMTFKRLKKSTPEELVFVAINRKEYPHEIRVKMEEVNRMARAVAIILPK